MLVQQLKPKSSGIEYRDIHRFDQAGGCLMLLRLNDSGIRKMSDYSVKKIETVKGKKKYFVRRGKVLCVHRYTQFFDYGNSKFRESII